MFNHDEENGDPMFFGVQAGALDDFSGDWRFWVLHDLSRVYGHANVSLEWWKDWDDMKNCVG